MPKLRWLLPAILFLALGCASASGSDGGDDGVTQDFQNPCTTSDECSSGHCVPFPDGTSKCTRPCDTQDCPDGMYCLPSSHDGGQYVCITPDSQFQCDSCTTSDECPGYMWCTTLQSQSSACLMDCSLLGLCPTGFVCQQMGTVEGKGVKVCIPQTGDCECTPEKEGTTRVCYLKNEFGTCEGIQTCTRGGWTTCDASEPGPEVCDHIDNDCNGEVDDVTDPTELSTLEHCGACFNPCPESPNEVDAIECRDGTCVMECGEGRYDPNGDPQDGCECMDDSQAGTDPSASGNLGSYTDCDDDAPFFNITGTLPVDGNGRGHDDYYVFHYENKWDISCWAYPAIAIDVPQGSVTMNICYGEGQSESSWSCTTVDPGQSRSFSLDPPGNGGETDYYIKVSASTSMPGCWTYTLRGYEE